MVGAARGALRRSAAAFSGAGNTSSYVNNSQLVAAAALQMTRRSFSPSLSPRMQWDALEKLLSSAPAPAGDKGASAEASTTWSKPAQDELWSRVKADVRLRQDRWAHPEAMVIFWLLRHADAPPRGEEEPSFDPSHAPGVGPNRDVLAYLIQSSSMLYDATTHAALPIAAVGSLVEAAAAGIASTAAADANANAGFKGDKRLQCLVRLPKLSEWVLAGEYFNDEALMENFGAEAAESVKAVALGKPRPRHSVLGHGTFRAAEHMWCHLAMMHAEEDADVQAELGMYRDAAAAAAGSDGAAAGAVARTAELTIQHMADDSPDYMRAAGGAMAVFRP